MGSSVRINGGQGTVLYNAGDLDEWDNIDDDAVQIAWSMTIWICADRMGCNAS